MRWFSPEAERMESLSLITIFLKAPIPGLVKTRLAKEYGEKKACSIYKDLAENVVRTAEESGHPVQINFYPDVYRELITDWLGDKYIMVPQTGDDLGDRMKNAFIENFDETCEKIILIGTDIPELDVTILQRAYSELINNDCVIGPSTDGGYYLIGFTKSGFRKEIFEGITWSTDTVFKKTLSIIKKLHLSVGILDYKTDIDTPEDYRKFIKQSGS